MIVEPKKETSLVSPQLFDKGTKCYRHYSGKFQSWQSANYWIFSFKAFRHTQHFQIQYCDKNEIKIKRYWDEDMLRCKDIFI